ncbi:MAG TPA: SMP-30/gluconolactonase/LRE family protein [Gemmatimonadales bacterium]|nr:SMP-30/gluconolactonase/LRE family protein [Gemmatimonadales bacterium]
MRLSQFLFCTVVIAAACKAEKKTPPPAAPPAAPTKVATVDSLQTPESVLWDAAQDVYFVSNINGSPGVKDNNGFISRVRPDGTIERLKFVESGKGGVTLNAPKGLALQGDTLWVTDIDAVRAFNSKTGAPIASVDVKGAVFLNDPAFGPDGALYFTDTGIRFDAKGAAQHPGPDRIFRLGAGRKVTDAIRDTLEWPNGITWDKANNRFIVVAFGGPAIMAWKQGDKAVTQIAHGPGGFDGVEFTNGGRLLVSSWADSSVSAYETGQEVKLITGVPSPADIGYDAKRNRVMIPVFTGNRVEIWQLP